ncbi:MAG: tetratricopeptide repeat protein [Chloroflexia bacterium]|nr:tetratricopeptide repeat protein [Chloroflexia bacterium]
MSGYYDLGSHTRTVSTSSADAQLWFDRGFNWTYGFNHEEAIKCFEKAVELDPDCPMAHWGIAYAVGPNYNKAWDAFDEAELAESLAKAFASTERAVSLLGKVTPVERALIEALQSRYQASEPPVDVADFAVWNDAYADAMRAVYREYGDDLDITALFAEALMNRTPWLLWDLPAACPSEGASTVEAIEALEKALKTIESRTHPGVLHMYIHLMEMSPHPEKALRASDWLRGLVPDAGHLEHMPTHIDVLCGHYLNVVTSNQDAIVADRKFLEREGAMNFYTLYRTHNYHFKLYGAMFMGQYETAMQAAAEMLSTIPHELVATEVPPMADWLEGFVPMNMHVLIRFGKWQEIIGTPLPDDPLLYCVTTAMIHYARGVALSATGRVAEAEREKELFEAAVSRVPDTRYLFNNSCLDILAIAAEMLNGELEYRKGNFDTAFAHLRRSIELDDGLPYDEPWGWMQPARHAYGALLLEQGHVAEAEAVYRADLGLDSSLARAYQHPENVWSLHGYHECLMRLGKHEMAGMIKLRLDLVAARADVPIEASCYCRMSQAA